MYQLWLYPLSMAVVWLIWLVLVFVVGLSLSLGLFWRVSVAGDSLQESTGVYEGSILQSPQRPWSIHWSP